MTRPGSNVGRASDKLNVELLHALGSIKAMRPKPKKLDIALYVLAGVVFLGVWFLFGIGSGRVL